MHTVLLCKEVHHGTSVHSLHIAGCMYVKRKDKIGLDEMNIVTLKSRDMNDVMYLYTLQQLHVIESTKQFQF
jgi:hypothetical protein